LVPFNACVAQAQINVALHQLANFYRASGH
jgi:hypothetical protein